MNFLADYLADGFWLFSGGHCLPGMGAIVFLTQYGRNCENKQELTCGRMAANTKLLIII